MIGDLEDLRTTFTDDKGVYYNDGSFGGGFARCYESHRRSSCPGRIRDLWRLVLRRSSRTPTFTSLDSTMK